MITLDDAATVNYFQNAAAKDIPLPYLSTKEGIRPLRTGDNVTFQQPVVLAYNFNKWGLQPTQRVTGRTERSELPISWEDSRIQEANGPRSVGGTHSIASFNVLNYFIDLGQDEPGCKAYEDRAGTPITANNCEVRGAYTPEALNDQQAKIVSAINTLDVSVLGLEEIQNSATFGQDRDAALAHLVDALNAKGGNWEYVKPLSRLLKTRMPFAPLSSISHNSSNRLESPAFSMTKHSMALPGSRLPRYLRLLTADSNSSR